MLRVIVFLLAISACAAVTPRDTETLTLLPGQTAFVIENQNWNLARVYAGTQRIGLFSFKLTDQVVVKRLSTTRFTIVVGFLASDDTWESEPWDANEYRCLRVRITNHLALSYVVPC